MRGRYKTNGTSYNFDKVWSGAQNGRFRKLLLTRKAYDFETKCIYKDQITYVLKQHVQGRYFLLLLYYGKLK